MAGLDPAEERRRLKETYSLMGDGEIEHLAGEAYDLTDLAKDALREEVAARGLGIELQEVRGAKPKAKALAIPVAGELVVVRQVEDVSEARVIKDALDNASIPSYFGPEEVDDIDRIEAAFEEGWDVKVRDVDQMAARWVLSHFRSAEPEPEGEYLPECPKCHSPEIVFDGLDDESEAAGKFHWHCDACEHQWVDDGVVERP